MRSVLIVDDESSIRQLVAHHFQRNHFKVYMAGNASKAWDTIQTETLDIVILDIMLPDTDGVELLKRLRRSEHDVPVMMLTAKGEEDLRVDTLQQGADDYIVKPFSPRELVARAEAVLRRTGTADDSPVLTIDSLHLDPRSREVSLNGQPIDLTATEFDLLFFLARNAGRVFAREEILDRLWGMDYIGETRVIDVHINHLRQKLQQAQRGSSQNRWIETVYGVGYKFRTAGGRRPVS